MGSVSFVPVVLVLLIHPGFVFSATNILWSYKDTSQWCRASKECCGKKQSPINLSSSLTPKTVQPFQFRDYDITPRTMKIQNNGHSVNVMITSREVKPEVSGGDLGYKYIFSGFHLHWGERGKCGSEHTLDAQHYDMELHLVHYSATYGSLKEALESKRSDALAVLGIWLKFVDSKDNEVFEPIIRELKTISYKGESRQLSPGFSLSKLLPKNINQFYRYLGSLTTPTCNEVVKWTVFKTPVNISKKQGLQFCQIFFNKKGEKADPMKNNFRPVQPINGRSVSLLQTKPVVKWKIQSTYTIQYEDFETLSWNK